MILPSKHLPQERALLTIGAEVLRRLDRPKTVSGLWEELRQKDITQPEAPPIVSYDWFVLALDFLFTIGAIELKSGLIKRQSP
jgi:hypothetical protein